MVLPVMLQMACDGLTEFQDSEENYARSRLFSQARPFDTFCMIV